MQDIEKTQKSNQNLYNQDQIKLRNVKRFETNLNKGSSVAQKCRLIYLWCKKMIKHWDEQLEMEVEQKKPDVKQQSVLNSSCKLNIKPLFK